MSTNLQTRKQGYYSDIFQTAVTTGEIDLILADKTRQ